MASKGTAITIDDDDSDPLAPVSVEEERRRKAKAQARDQAKAQEKVDEDREKEAKRKERAIQKAEDLKRLKSGEVMVTEILSDEEATSKPTSNGPCTQVKPRTQWLDTPTKTSAEPNSTLAGLSTTNPWSAEQSSTRTPSRVMRPIPASNSAGGSSPATPRDLQGFFRGPEAVKTTTIDNVIPNEVPKPAAAVQIIDLFPRYPNGHKNDEGDKPANNRLPPETGLNNRSHAEALESRSRDSHQYAHSIQNEAKVISKWSGNNTPSGVSAKLKLPRKHREQAQPGNGRDRRDEIDFVSSLTMISRDQNEVDSHVLPTPALTPATLPDYLDEPGHLEQEGSIIPLHTDNIECLLMRHQETLHADQEALVSTRFSHAQEQLRLFAGPTRKNSKSNPFKNIISTKTTGVIPADKDREPNLVLQSSRITAKTGKKAGSAYLYASSFTVKSQYVPKVKSIGRLGASRDLLARNVRTLTHMPWFPENEMETATEQEQGRYDELQQRYDNNIERRRLQRRCRAIASIWRPQVVKLLLPLGLEVEDVLYYMLHDDENEQPQAGTLSPELQKVWYYRAEDCPSCASGDDCRSPQWRKIASLIKRPPTERRLAMAGLLCAAYYRTLKMNIWHVVSDMNYALELQQNYLTKLGRVDPASENDLKAFCYACGQFECTIHGSYAEKDDIASNDDSINDSASHHVDVETELSSDIDANSEGSHEGEVILDDPELCANAREYAALPFLQKPAELHKCGVFCFGMEVPVEKMLGLQSDGSVSGLARTEMLDDEPPLFDDSTLCDSEMCFWDTVQRDQTAYDMILKDFNRGGSMLLFQSEADYKLCQSLLPMSLTSKRGPCELALAIPSATCLGIFYLMLCSSKSPAHSTAMRPSAITMNKDANVDRSNDKTLERRQAFVPCAHAGPCQPDICTCATDKISCESSCGCSKDCSRRFQGCSCRDGRRKACFEDARCECWAGNRECDPSLCIGCGVQEVLDPINRNRTDLEFRCKNSRIQFGVPKRTVMGVSEVHGWGLYAGEAIARSDFISEYKGELISILEGNRRGAVYHNLGLEYLFKLSKDQELDGSRVSNKSRFINNSSLAKNINVLSKKLLCNGVSRIMLYAARDIAAGEELFYDYGYHKRVRANFKEKPDPVKRTMLPPFLSTNTNFTAPNIAETTAPSVRSKSRLVLANNEEDSDELGDTPAFPTSEPDSEFGMPEDTMYESSSNSENSDVRADAEGSGDSDTPLSTSIGDPAGFRRLTSRSGPSTALVSQHELFSSPPHNLNNRPKKKLRILQPKMQLHSDSDSDTSLDRRRTASRNSSGKVSRGKDATTLRRPGRPRKIVQEDERLRQLSLKESERKRRVSSTDKRFGGASQRKAAETLRKRREAERKAAELSSPAGVAGEKRKRREEGGSSVAKEPSSQPLRKLKLSQPKGLTWPGARESLLDDLDFPAAPNVSSASQVKKSWNYEAKQSAAKDVSSLPNPPSDDASVSMSESSRSPSPYTQLAVDTAQQNSSFSSTTFKRAALSGFASESTRSILLGSPAKLEAAGGKMSKQQQQQHQRHLLGNGTT